MMKVIFVKISPHVSAVTPPHLRPERPATSPEPSGLLLTMCCCRVPCSPTAQLLKWCFFTGFPLEKYAQVLKLDHFVR